MNLMQIVSPDTERQAVAVQPTGSLAGELQRLPVRIGPSPWPGWEHVRGFGVFALPFSSGHVLTLRNFPQNDFAPFVTVWHRTPEGDWSIFYDAPRPDIACPRHFGPAARLVQPSHITLTWTGPMALRVEMDDPPLLWTLSMKSTPLLRAINAVYARMPLSSWRSRRQRRVREWMAGRLLGMGDIALSGTMPSGHYGILMPQRVFFIAESRAVLDGVDLGEPARVDHSPRIGEVPLSARPIFAVGQAFWRIRDEEEYRRTVEELSQAAGRGEIGGLGGAQQGHGSQAREAEAESALPVHDAPFEARAPR